MTKFKIGDKVVVDRALGRSFVFVIDNILITNAGVFYKYADDDKAKSVYQFEEKDLKIFVEPKPKVKKYLWAYKRPNGAFAQTNFFYKDDNDLKTTLVVKDSDWFQRLDWSMIEVDE